MSCSFSLSKIRKMLFGHFSVKNCVGQVGYEFDLPHSSRIHTEVHVSLLRTYFSEKYEELDIGFYSSLLDMSNRYKGYLRDKQIR